MRSRRRSSGRRQGTAAQTSALTSAKRPGAAVLRPLAQLGASCEAAAGARAARDDARYCY